MWYLSQIGRREHYALACYLFKSQRLKVFYTDYWLPNWAQYFAGKLPKQITARWNRDLSKANVRSFGVLPAIKSFYSKFNDPFDRWVKEGEFFGSFAAKEFQRHNLGESSTLLGYTCGNLEQIAAGNEVNTNTIHVQIDPGPKWYDVRRQEQERFPECEDVSPSYQQPFFERISREIELAKRVVVHSEHSRYSLGQHGFDLSRIVVVPPAFCGNIARPRHNSHSNKIRALFVGNICLAKGFHVFAEAARLAKGEFEFLAAGNSAMRHDYISRCRKDVTFLGHLPYRELQDLMNKVDVLVFPTLSDGFGLVQLEAMAMGLPVLATANCGEVVVDGQNGFIIPVGCHNSILERLAWLKANSDQYSNFSANAINRVKEFTPERHFALLERLAR